MRVTRVLFILFILIATSVKGWSQNTGPGVYFEKTSLEQIQKKAARLRKPIFIELYSPSCHVCESFKPTFNKAEVGKFYNGQFLNYKLNIDSKESQAFIQKQNLFIPSLPLLLFYDADLNLNHIQIVNNEASELINAAKRSQAPGSRGIDFKKIYAAGERNQNFLIEYGFFSRITRDTIANIQAVESYIHAIKTSEFESQTNFLVIQKVVMDVFNPLFDHFINHKESYEKKYTKQMVDDTAENIIMTTLFSSRSTQFSKSQFDLIQEYLLKLKTPSETRNRLIIPKIKTYLIQKNYLQLSVDLDSYIQDTLSANGDKVFLLNYALDLSGGNQIFIKNLLKLSNESILYTLKASEKPELYLLKAKIYLALSDKEKARTYADIALKTAKDEKLEIEKFQKIYHSAL